MVERLCVHVNVHLHFVVQNLHQLLHGGQMARLEFGPYWHIYKRTRTIGLPTVKYFLETIILLILIDGHNQIKNKNK